MYWLRWMGFGFIGIAVAALLAIPWLRSNGRAGETDDAIITSAICAVIAAGCLLWRRRQAS